MLRWMLIAAMTIVAAMPMVASAAPHRPIARAELDRFLDRTIRPAMNRKHVAGVTVAVVQDGRILALRGYGRAGVSPDRPVDPARTSFGLASLSKVFTWIALLQAAETGRVDLTRDVNGYLAPDLRNPANGMRPIRVVDLMRHTTGFEDRDVMVLSKAAFGGRFPTLADYLRDARPDRIAQPGTVTNYSNYAVNQAAAIALRGSGARDFPTLIERDILTPLGMTGTTLRQPYPAGARLPAPMPAALAARRTQNLRWDGGRFVAQPYEFMFDGPASSISATAADMARLMLAQLNGGALDGARIYGPATATRFRTPLIGGAQSNGWAHGLMMRRLPGGHPAYGHDGVTSTTAAAMYVVPDLDLGIFAAANDRDGGDIVWTLPDAVVRAFYAPQAPGLDRPRPADPAFRQQADLYTGHYLSMRRPHSGLAKLVYFEPVSVGIDDAGYLVAPSGGRDRRWVPARTPGAFVDAEGEDVIAFTTDADGRATGWRDAMASRTYERVPALLSIEVMLGLLAASALASVGVLVAAAWRWRRRRRRASPAAATRRFDRVEVAMAGAVLLAVACIAWTVTHQDMGGGAPFPPPSLRGFSVLMGLAAACVVALIAMTRALWRAGGGWRRLPRILAYLPVGLLAIWIGNAGGLAFWS